MEMTNIDSMTGHSRKNKKRTFHAVMSRTLNFRSQHVEICQTFGNVPCKGVFGNPCGRVCSHLLQDGKVMSTLQ